MKGKGFTLVEMMVAVAVIGVLTAMLVPQVGQMLERSKISRTAAELVSIAHAMDLYLTDTASYPPSVSDLGRAWGADVGLVNRGNVVATHLAMWNGPYLKSWPIRTAWGGIVGCGAVGAYYAHPPIGWINLDGVAGNDVWIHMNPYCVSYPPSRAVVIDALLDDGNPSTGNIRLGGGVPEYIYYYVGEGRRAW